MFKKITKLTLSRNMARKEDDIEKKVTTYYFFGIPFYTSILDAKYAD